MRTTHAFAAVVAELRDLYDQEVSRLAEALRPRIQAGEFSGNDDDGPRYLRLADELLATHPWLKTDRLKAMVAASSHWFSDFAEALGDLGDDGFQQSAQVCLAHDVLAAAARYGWVHAVKRLTDPNLYAPKVPAGRRGGVRFAA
jgi:hypothetical protein